MNHASRSQSDCGHFDVADPAITKAECLLFGLLVQLALAVHMPPLQAQDPSATIVGIIKDSVTGVYMSIAM